MHEHTRHVDTSNVPTVMGYLMTRSTPKKNWDDQGRSMGMTGWLTPAIRDDIASLFDGLFYVLWTCEAAHEYRLSQMSVIPQFPGLRPGRTRRRDQTGHRI